MPKTVLGKNFKNVCNWRSFCIKNNASNIISLDFNAVNMFSKYVWHVHNVKYLLKLFFGLLRPSVRDTFEIFTQLTQVWPGQGVHLRLPVISCETPSPSLSWSWNFIYWNLDEIHNIYIIQWNHDVHKIVGPTLDDICNYQREWDFSWQLSDKSIVTHCRLKIGGILDASPVYHNNDDKMIRIIWNNDENGFFQCLENTF